MIHFFVIQHGMKIKDSSLDTLLHNILNSVPLNLFPWSWQEKVYFGAAHGTAGILLTLARLNHYVDKTLFEEFMTMSACSGAPTTTSGNGPTTRSRTSGITSSATTSGPIQNSSSGNISNSSGNYKSSSTSRHDDLVQWCHGAPGVVPLLLDYLLLVYDKENGQSSSATHSTLTNQLNRSLDLIWERGMLTKGCGICHGLSGNGYAFLTSYLQTNDLKHLNRALGYMKEILLFKSSVDRCCQYADHPYSLFEGLAGVTHFLMDILKVVTILKGTETSSQQLSSGNSIPVVSDMINSRSDTSGNTNAFSIVANTNSNTNTFSVIQSRCQLFGGLPIF
jgi:lantibiotic modifying enzyme